MAISVLSSAYVSGGNKTAAASVAMTTAATADVDDVIVIALSLDNAGASGTSAFSSISQPSTGAVTWETAQVLTRTAGTALDGVTIVVCVGVVTTQIPSGETITANFSPNVTAKAYTGWLIEGADPNWVNIITGSGNVSVSLTSNATPTRAVQTDDIVIGSVAGETATVPGGDADTLNGSWSAVSGASSGGSGGDQTKVMIASQSKIVAGNGNQSYNVSVGQDYAAILLTLAPAAVSGDKTVSCSVAVGVATASSPTVDASGSARTAAGVLARADARFEPSVVNARALVGVVTSASVAGNDTTVTARVVAGVALVSSARPEPSAAATTEVGVATRSGALAEWSFVSTTEVGVHTRAGGARPEPSAAAVTEVGVLVQSGGARPEPNAATRALVGAVAAAGGARPEPSSASTVEVAVLTSSAPTMTVTAAALALAGVITRSQPQAGNDIAVGAVVSVGVVVSAGAVVDVPTVSRAAVGITSRAGALFEPGVVFGRAYLGAALRSTVVPEPSVVARALVGAALRSTPAAEVLATSRVLAGLVARGVPTVTITAAAAVRAGIVTLAVPTVVATASGRVVVGVVTYGLGASGVVVIVLPERWTTWSEVGASRYREPVATTYTEPDPSRYREPATTSFEEA